MADILVITETEQIVEDGSTVQFIELSVTEVLTEEAPGQVLEVAAEPLLLESTATEQEYLEHGTQELLEVARQGPAGPPGPQGESGGNTGAASESRTNADTLAFLAGHAVYPSADGQAKLARADSAATCRVLGLAAADIVQEGADLIQLDSYLDLTVPQWEAVTGMPGPLAINQVYYLSDTTPGCITPSAPDAPGSFVCPVGKALSATRMFIDIATPIQL